MLDSTKPLSIISSAVIPGADDFGDSLVNRLGLTGAGAEATRNLIATQGAVRGAVSILGLVILLYSVFSFTWLFGYAPVVIGAAVAADV